MKKKDFKIYTYFLFKSLSFVAVVAFAVILLDYLDPTSENLSRLMDSNIKQFGVAGMLGFILLSSVLSSFFVPRQVLGFVGGYAYGVWVGTALTTIGVALGCLLTIMYSRFLLQKFVQNKFGLRIAWVTHLFSKNPFAMALSIRIIPVGSNVILNMLVGVTTIPLIPYCLGSLVGYIPQNLVSALLGAGLRDDPFLHSVLAIILYCVGIVGGLWLFRRYKPENCASIRTIIKSLLKPDSPKNDDVV